MCGIAGALYHVADRPEERLRSIGVAMSEAIAHRGPDDEGVWSDPSAGLVLSHRRLSIIDLSAQGHQPMMSATGRFVVTYNGELYNFERLRAELGVPPGGWRGHSDTEVMLAAFERWGVQQALKRFNGMFALAVWDRRSRTLYLARDPMGEKPLYYGRIDGGTAFGSDLGALRRADGWSATIDREAVGEYLRYGYVPGARSIYRGVAKLLPGHVLVLDGASPRPELPVPVPFWNVAEEVRDAVASPYRGSAHDAVNELDALLRDAVQLRTASDVPYGAFLSGGIDSSTVVALMQAQSTRPVRTFTVGFGAAEYDETSRAAAVARHLGTEHTEVRLAPDDALELVPALAGAYTEPFADSSQLPTMLVARVARRHVTMALSGDGGDELFGGYSRYPLAERLWRRVAWLPARARAAVSRGVQALPDSVLRLGALPLRRAAHEYGRGNHLADKMRKLAEVASAPDERALYERLTSQPLERLLAGGAAPVADPAGALWNALPSYLRRMQYLDLVRYLPDDILVKVDRAAMWVSLETRVPLLDPRVVAFAWRLSDTVLRFDGAGKWPLRSLLARYVPVSLVTGPKRGFAVPLGEWLRGPLRVWMQDLLAPDRLRRDGLLDAAGVQALVREHLDGSRNWQAQLWTLLVFNAWLDAERSGPVRSEDELVRLAC